GELSRLDGIGLSPQPAERESARRRLEALPRAPLIAPLELVGALGEFYPQFEAIVRPCELMMQPHARMQPVITVVPPGLWKSFERRADFIQLNIEGCVHPHFDKVIAVIVIRGGSPFGLFRPPAAHPLRRNHWPADHV